MRVTRWRCVALGAGALLAVALLGLPFRGQRQPGTIDTATWEFFRHPRFWATLDALLAGRSEEVVSALSPAASPGAAFVAAAAMGLAYWFVGERRLALFCASAAPLAVAITDLVAKPLFDRTLRGSLAYPSGHMTATVATGAVLVVLAARSGGRRRAVLTAVAWSGVVGLLFVYTFVRRSHYLGDIARWRRHGHRS